MKGCLNCGTVKLSAEEKRQVQLAIEEMRERWRRQRKPYEEVATVSLTVHTARRWYAGPDRLDISRAGNDPLGRYFAPSQELHDWVQQAGKSEETWEKYVEAYVREMRQLYRLNRRPWEELAARETVTLVCYCESFARCHRSLLADILVKLKWTYAGEYVAKPVFDLVLERRKQGWVEHKFFAWIMRNGEVAECLHCQRSAPYQASGMPAFVLAHVGCAYVEAEVARA
jgi:uncharacterized protein YeaO (DUF488 family)